MTDFLSAAERSERMSRIKSRDTKPEIALRRSLHRLGLRFRLGGAGLPGRPDIVFPKYRTVVFVHGCFWHRHHGCRVASTPKSNTQFWEEKFARNIERDLRVVGDLQFRGWKVVIVWECELGSRDKMAATVARVAKQIASSQFRDAGIRHETR